jgi:organic radical activating enzyme
MVKFSSFREGLHVGLRQIFLRFHACNLACAYCDTNAAKEPEFPEFCIIEKTPGRRDFIRQEIR